MTQRPRQRRAHHRCLLQDLFDSPLLPLPLLLAEGPDFGTESLPLAVVLGSVTVSSAFLGGTETLTVP